MIDGVRDDENEYMQGYEMDFLQSVRLCEMAVRHGVKLLFLSSGGTVYGNQKVQPITELAPTHPINHYAALKLCIENVMRIAEITNTPYAHLFGAAADPVEGIVIVPSLRYCRMLARNSDHVQLLR